MASLANFYSVAEFARRNPSIVPSEGSLRWYLRSRNQNGLVDTGAVVEMRARSGQLRPKILVNEERFAAWLLDRNRVDSTGRAKR